eukprot:TRINITY_DN73986_c0_g1_i1.p1 TRINITY_DN73986_c0_g1~~TRINITY_DN73986_c0_g1_i1.p1  ORF type:complete len:184 (+),score=13.99 TRINITY_DN73986_c0_g1_i1:80-631(+)
MSVIFADVSKLTINELCDQHFDDLSALAHLDDEELDSGHACGTFKGDAMPSNDLFSDASPTQNVPLFVGVSRHSSQAVESAGDVNCCADRAVRHGWRAVASSEGLNSCAGTRYAQSYGPTSSRVLTSYGPMRPRQAARAESASRDSPYERISLSSGTCRESRSGSKEVDPEMLQLLMCGTFGL